MAQSAAAASDADTSDFVRVAGLLAQQENYVAAADEYQKAIDSFGAQQPPWSLYLLKGGALEQAGQWDKARAELERANQLAPDHPVILHYLGYAQIARRRNIDEALALIQKASGLQPAADRKSTRLNSSQSCATRKPSY